MSASSAIAYNFIPNLPNSPFSGQMGLENQPVIGQLDVAEIAGECLLLEGWLLLEKKDLVSTPEIIHVIINDKIAGSCKPNLERRDVMEFIGRHCPRVCGFKTLIPLEWLDSFPETNMVGIETPDGMFTLPARGTKNLSLYQNQIAEKAEFSKLAFIYGMRNFFQIVPLNNERLCGRVILVECGGNTGNLLFQRSIARQIGLRNMEFFRERISDCKIAVFCLANYLREDIAAPDPLVASVLNNNPALPVCFIGLGAQAPHTGYKLRIAPALANFFRLVSERSVSIGVRDEYTAETLNSLGIKNSRVIGCPAMFYNQLAMPLVKKNPEPRFLNPVYGISANSIDQAAEGANKIIMKDALANSRPVILQSLPCFMDLALNNPVPESVAQCQEFLRKLGFPPTKANLEKLADILQVFIEPADWIWFMKNHDFYIGSRIHGVIASLLAGTPALLLTHDSRTEGLARTLHVPTLPVAQFEVSQTARYYEETDFENFNSSYMSLYTSYLDFLDENHVPHVGMRPAPDLGPS